MLTVADYGKIRRAKRDGMSIRAIARTFHHSRHTIRKALDSPEPEAYPRREKSPSPVLGSFKAIIDQVLTDDEQEPRKQRHTAARLYRRLRDELGYRGSYDQIRRYVRRKRRRQRETFIPLDHAPGQRLEADFGHIYVDFPQGRQLTPIILNTWSFSDHRFAMGMPTERIEAILAGMVQAFEFFGCVSREVWWDNPRTVATAILKGRQREIHKRYEALASHYLFDPLFCMVARGNEKSYVENSVYDLQRDWATPVPKVQNLNELNQYLRQCCLRKLDHTVSGQSETIRERFEREKAAALPLPLRAFDPCVTEDAKVDKYQMARYDSNRYSVPRRWAFEFVTVKAYVDHIEIVADGKVIAVHKRSYERGQKILNPEHYLAVLGRRPAALDHSNVFHQWELPACFTELRKLLEERHGPPAGVRQYIRVLQLLAQHPAKRVQQAIEYGCSKNALHADLIIQHTHRLAQRQQPQSESLEELSQNPGICQIQVPKPDLNQFDQLFTDNQGETNYV